MMPLDVCWYWFSAHVCPTASNSSILYSVASPPCSPQLLLWLLRFGTWVSAPWSKTFLAETISWHPASFSAACMERLVFPHSIDHVAWPLSAYLNFWEYSLQNLVWLLIILFFLLFCLISQRKRERHWNIPQTPILETVGKLSLRSHNCPFLQYILWPYWLLKYVRIFWTEIAWVWSWGHNSIPCPMEIPALYILHVKESTTKLWSKCKCVCLYSVYTEH